VLVGAGIESDMEWLEKMLRVFGYTLPSYDLVEIKDLTTKIWGETMGLNKAAAKVGVKNGNAHDALADAWCGAVTAHRLGALIRERGGGAMVTTPAHTRLAEIEAVARKVREEYASYYADEDDTQSLWSLGLCQNVSRDLKKALDEVGISSDLRHGMYYGAEESYAGLLAADRDESPEECEDWDGGWTHWWVIADDLIIDLTADQFHPSEPEEYEVVITTAGDPVYR